MVTQTYQTELIDKTTNTLRDTVNIVNIPVKIISEYRVIIYLSF